MQQNEYIENKDIIDLKKIFKIIYKNVRFVLLFTSFVVIVAIIYIFTKKPIYQVESNIQIGHIENNLLARPDILGKNVQIYFKVKDTEQNSKSFVSMLSELKLSEVSNFIIIKTQAYTNEEALKKNQEVVYYIQNLYQDKIEQYKTSIKTQIEINKAKIIAIEKFQKQDLQEQIEILKKEKSSLIDAKLLDNTFLEDRKRIVKIEVLNKLQYQLNIELLDKKQKLEKEIENLNFQLSEQNIKNSEIVGGYLISDKPIKPKKILIILISLIIGFIFALLIVFIKEYMFSNKAIDNKKI